MTARPPKLRFWLFTRLHSSRRWYLSGAYPTVEKATATGEYYKNALKELNPDSQPEYIVMPKGKYPEG